MSVGNSSHKSMKFKIELELDPETAFGDVRKALDYMVTHNLPCNLTKVMVGDTIPRWDVVKLSGCIGKWWVE